MGFKHLNLEGYNDLIQTLENLDEELLGIHATKTTIIFFVGSKDNETSLSWCPDCVKAEPIVLKAINELDLELDAIFITCNVGSKEMWDPLFLCYFLLISDI